MVFLWWDSNLKEIEPHQRSNLQAQPKLMGTGEETVSLMGGKSQIQLNFNEMMKNESYGN